MSWTPVDLTLTESTEVVCKVLAPLVAQGAVVRRPRATAWAERHQADRVAHEVLTALRERHGGAPLVLRVGTRRLVVVTRPDDVRRLLDGSPEPFTPATKEKRGALAHFQPEGVLISPTFQRQRRRRLNEHALQTDHAVHDDGTSFVGVVRRGAAELADRVARTGGLDAEAFSTTWWRIVLNVVLGTEARTDHDLLNALERLRRDANVRHPWRAAEVALVGDTASTLDALAHLLPVHGRGGGGLQEVRIA